MANVKLTPQEKENKQCFIIVDISLLRPEFQFVVSILKFPLGFYHAN